MHLRDLPHRSKMYILAGVLLAMLLGALDATIVGPALPSIVRELGGMQYLSWVFIIYSLTSTIAIPIVGKLSDLYGRKYFYLGGITVFLAGSMLCGTAGSAYLDDIFTALTGAPHEMFQLIVFRGLQGLGAGTMMANGMAIIGDLFAPRERGRYQGLMGGVFGLASVIGPAVGGWLTDNLSWRWIFFVNLPIGLLALAVLAAVMTKPEHGRSHSVDWWGSLALTAGLVPLLLALNLGGSKYAWDSAVILGLFAVAFASLLTFGFLERRASEPILDLVLFRDRGFSASMVVLFFSGVGMFGSIMFLPLFLQVVVGRSAASSGALLMPMMLGMVGASIVTGQLISRTGRYKIFGIVGLAIASLGMFLLSRLTVETGNGSVALYMVLVGLGSRCHDASLHDLAAVAVSEAHRRGHRRPAVLPLDRWHRGSRAAGWSDELGLRPRVDGPGTARRGFVRIGGSPALRPRGRTDQTAQRRCPADPRGSHASGSQAPAGTLLRRRERSSRHRHLPNLLLGLHPHRDRVHRHVVRA